MSKLQPQQRYAVVGLGASGLSCVRFLLQHNIKPLVCDTRLHPAGLDSLPAELEVVTGGLPLQALLKCNVVLVSPGVALATPELQTLAKAGVQLMGDVELFCHYANAPVVAITGSNGKSTVTSLVGEMAKQAGLTVAVGGNIGVPVLDLLDSQVQVYVLELSSFQLETTYNLRAKTATVLNISEDHMDRYPGLNEYIAAKHKIAHQAEQLVVNLDDPQSWPEDCSASQISFSIQQTADFSLSQDQAYLLRGEQRLIETSSLPLVGTHNYANILAALALAQAVGIDMNACVEAAQQFSGLAHRCQLVARKNGIAWINDSKATNVGATLAALQGLSGNSGRLWLIVGGDSKDGDLDELTAAFSELGGVVAFGKDKHRFLPLSNKVCLSNDLESAFKWCVEHAGSGDTVLLSPACASLDMYRNFEARGQHFCQLVEDL